MQHNIDGLDSVQGFSLWKIPNAIILRIILFLLFLSILILVLYIENYSAAFYSTLAFFSLLWVANYFDYQQQQLKQLKYRLHVLEQKINPLAPVHHQPSSEQASLEDLSANPSNVEHNTEAQNAFTDITPFKQPLAVVVSEQHEEITPQPTFSKPPIPQIAASSQQSEDYHVMTSFWQAGLNWFKGGNSIVRVAIIILLIGVILLLRFASEYWQLSLSVKMTAIAAAGFSLTGLGYYLRRKRFDYAVSLQGAGLGIVFLTLFTSYHFEALQSVMLAYAALTVLLTLTLWLAIRQNALFLAFIALGSGFIAPFLLNTGEQDIPALMAYLFTLNLALAVIALFKPWRILNSIALLLTFGIGGVSIWQYVQAEQKLMVACWVWAIFVLYLFISIRYSQHVANIHQKIKDIPLVDTTLIFATPFMAFSLYAILMDSKSDALSIASAILSVVYLTVGYFIHRKDNLLSVLSQCFYGLGFVFLALILPFAFDAYWSSVGWAVHGIAMLYFGWRYQLRGAKYFAVLLLFISGIASVIAGIFDEKSLLFASTVIMLVYGCAHQLFRSETSGQKQEGEQALDNFLSNGFLFGSFLAASYVYDNGLTRLDVLHQDLSIAWLLWFVVLSLVWRWKQGAWSLHWLKITMLLLGVTAAWSLGYQLFIGQQTILYALPIALKFEFLVIAALWCTIFVMLSKSLEQSFNNNISRLFQAVFAAIALLFLGGIGLLFASNTTVYTWSAIVPIIVLLSTLYLKPVQSLQYLWVANPAWIVVASIWLVWVSLNSAAQSNFAYIPVLNLTDLCSILVFGLLSYAIKPYLLKEDRSTQLINAGLLLLLGLLVLSSMLLRVLYHYMQLPYWSAEAWQNSTLQMALTILWASLALILTLLASKKALRYIWMLGIAVLGIVIAKLIFLDLSHSQTLTRIISFIGSGIIMLVIGYFAPLPPHAANGSRPNQTQEKTEA